MIKEGRSPAPDVCRHVPAPPWLRSRAARQVGKTKRVTMTNNELNAFRRALRNCQAELGNRNGNREALTIETSPDELDRIQHASDRDFALGNLERNSGRLREVRSALGRVDAGTFGICIGCEENINPRRLAAVPWASLCIVCQQAADRGQQTPLNEIGTSLAMAA